MCGIIITGRSIMDVKAIALLGARLHHCGAAGTTKCNYNMINIPAKFICFHDIMGKLELCTHPKTLTRR